jgi:hypothetical protein
MSITIPTYVTKWKFTIEKINLFDDIPIQPEGTGSIIV